MITYDFVGNITLFSALFNFPESFSFMGHCLAPFNNRVGRRALGWGGGSSLVNNPYGEESVHSYLAK